MGSTWLLLNYRVRSVGSWLDFEPKMGLEEWQDTMGLKPKTMVCLFHPI